MNIRPRNAIPTRQRGAALMVVLILLLIMTLLGLASLRGTLMEERMSAALFDRSLSFQGTEAALREAEALVQATGRTGFPTNGSCNADGLCDTPDPNNPHRWLDDNAAYWRSATVAVGSLTATPQFFIEYMGQAPSWPKCDSEIPIHASCLKSRYRVTARSTQVDRAQVILQSNYAGS